MKCVICGRTVKTWETYSFVNLYRGDERRRTLYACGTCGCEDGPFDRLIDALPTGPGDQPQEVCRAEIEALILATDPKRLEKRLREARSVLTDTGRKTFGRGRFDFANRRLIGNNGLALQWFTRAMPDKPVAYLNQQTSIGHVSVCTASEG